ncbi:PKD domain-containing protein [Arenibacter certesii]|uniref:PKD domain-containing protein n=3 Tax=Arenibacter certesii TaxID=228955 RepID=UPI00047CB927|nr:malectin domain-containing carbohydrate-binding protein [Arenibacter certesii]
MCNVICVLLLQFAFYQSTAQLPTEFQKVDLLTGLGNATMMRFAPDGRIFVIDRYGELLIYKPLTQSTVSAGTLPVFHGFEDGFLGLAFDPNFASNQKIYIYYSLISTPANRISQFSMNGDILDLSSEVPMMEWPVQRVNSYHAAGDMAFDSQGNLYIAIGDNANHGLYGAIDEGNSNNSAERTSANTNDLRGKIIRIKPNAGNGSYTIPNGNLFPGGVGGLPEIYVMGTRNPYRIFVDKDNTDWLFWGEVGPDANVASAMGPEGRDEINLTKEAGNYGWPYFSGAFNDPYQVNYRTPSPYYNDPSAPENTSKWNTGATLLPEAKPAWIEFFHKSYFAGPRYYYDGNATDQQRLPIEFDGLFFYYDFNTSQIWAVEIDVTGNVLSNQKWAPTVFPSSAKGFIDMKIGPDGHLYILEYGTGCCPQNSGTGKLVRVDYTGISTNSPPSVVINADVTSGSLPLTVNFTSTGTVDPNGDSPLSYAWDFQTNGTVEATTANASYTFTVAGTYNVQLRVDDGKGGVGVQNVTIHAGNNAATFTFNSPLDGGFVGWGDDIILDLFVSDLEDGSTDSGIDCTNVSVVPSLGHLNHFHDGATVNGCPQTLTLQYEGHDIDGGADLFYVIGTHYTDQGGLQAFDQIQMHPRRKEAEYYDTQSGVEIIANTDPDLGGVEAIRVDNNSYISFLGRNLFNINSVKYRVASTMVGGTIELRTGSTNGPLVSTTVVPTTGGLNNWTYIESSFTAPVGKHDLFFVFKSNSSSQDIFDVNFVEFIGAGVSIDNSPPLVNSVKSINTSKVKVVFSEYVTQTSASQVSNYFMDNGISISSAVLQPDDRSVVLTVSPLNPDTTYNLQISNVENISGLAIITGSYSFSTIGSIRINVGGPQVILDSNNFVADQFVTGGSLYSSSAPIAGTNDDALYQTERYGAFTYEIPVPESGDYDIRLHFAELYYGVGSQSGGPGSRVFNVSIEGTQVLANFDILTEVAPATALRKEFDNISVVDGFVTIQFSKVIENAKLSGIEILSPSTFGNIPNISITSPSNGANVNETFDVNFSVENWTIEEGGTHLHYSIDGQLVGPHYNNGPITIDGLSLGSHTILLELYDVGHVPTGVFDEISVNVQDQVVCNATSFPNSWTVHQLGTNPYTAVYTIPDHDLDGDGLKDIVTGGWWYKNPGSASGNWIKSTIGGNFGNVVHVYDFDGDGHMDLLGTALGSGAGNEYKSKVLLWAKNDGSGNFTVYNNIPAGSTTYYEPFLAGIAGGNFGLGSPYQMAINWNGAESPNYASPVQLLTPSADPTTGMWTLVNISNDSSGEDIKAGDIDGDGDLDLFQGINWLRNNGNGIWTTFSTGITYDTTPDRIQLADFNGDGRLDAVVGQLGVGGSGTNRSEFAWFEAPADPTQPWIRHVLSTSVTGSLSVFAIDIDFDQDIDIVVGEWLGSRRLIAFENDLCSTGAWITHILDDGALNLEHHDGAMVTDIDNDGDLDVISNGWTVHKQPRIYENTTITSGSQNPLANAGNDKIITLPGTTSATFNGTGTDPDGGVIVSYEWTQQSGPNMASLSGENTTNLTVTGLIAGTYVFRLTVTDDENETGTDDVKLMVQTSGSSAPLVSAGTDQSITLPTNNIILNGTGSDPDGGAVNFLWTKVSGPTAALSGTTTASLTANNLVEGSYVFRLTVTDDENDTSFDEVGLTVLPQPSSGFALRINAGGPQVTLGTDNFAADQYASGGSLYSASVAIGGTQDDELYQTERYGAFTYEIPVPQSGEYDIKLHFAELYFGVGSKPGGPGSRVFNVSIEGNPVLVDFDILSEVSPATILLKTFNKVVITDGFATIQFSKVIENPKISGIEVLGSGSSSSPPIANAGADKTITLPTNSTIFNGTGTDPDGGAISTYQWTQVSGPNTASLSGANTPDLSVGGLVAGNYVFRLTVTDDQNETGTDDFSLVVQPAGGAAPIANAGANKTITLPTNSTTFTGTGTDPDGGAISTYQWSQVSGPNTASLSGANTPDLTVGGLVAGNYVFRLTVTDDQNETGTDDVSLVVQPAGGAAPIANAGADKTITLPTNSTTFIGTGSDPDGGTVSYFWTKISGPTAVLSGTATASLTAGSLVEGSYVFRLTVTDDENDTSFDEVGLTVLPPTTNSFALRINAGGPQTTYNGNVFEADQYFDVGTSLDRPQTGLSQPYRTLRYSSSMVMGYNLPVPNGQYTVLLHFAENWFGATGGGAGGVGSRVFDISMEGQLVEDNLDVYAEAGAQTKLVKSYTVTVTGGILDLDFSSLAGNGGVKHPIINAIEVLGDSGTNGPQGVASKGADAISTVSSNIQIENSEDVSKSMHIVSIAPNPANSIVVVTLWDSSLEIIAFSLHDIGGRLIGRVKALESKSLGGVSSYDVSHIESGLYIINITTNNGISSRHKLIINR